MRSNLCLSTIIFVQLPCVLVLSFSLNHPIINSGRQTTTPSTLTNNNDNNNNNNNNNDDNQFLSTIFNPRPSLTSVLSSTASDTEIDTSTRVVSTSISRPKVHWTVPGFKVGWQDESGNWLDEDGPRNGPPQNYWRQMSDEREYNRDMDALNIALLYNNIDTIEETVVDLEKRRSIRRPSLHRKMLGRWAPILLNGQRADSTPSLSYNNNDNNKMPVDDNDTMIEVPYILDISRANGRKYAPKNYYGIFDLKVSVGEELSVRVVSDHKNENENNVMINITIDADDTNEPRFIGQVEENKPIYFGGITYVTDYIRIQRNPEGKIDFWLRLDDSYMGVKDPNVAMGEVKVE